MVSKSAPTWKPSAEHAGEDAGANGIYSGKRGVRVKLIEMRACLVGGVFYLGNEGGRSSNKTMLHSGYCPQMTTNMLDLFVRWDQSTKKQHSPYHKDSLGTLALPLETNQ